MKKYIKPIVAALIAVVFLAVYLGPYEYVSYFYEQHHLFRYTWAYVQETVHQFGIWYLLTEFVVQFGYYTWLLAIIWAALGVLTYLMATDVIRRLTGLRDWLQLGAIPAVYMLFGAGSVDQFPVAVIKTFVITLFVWIVARIIVRFVPFFSKRYENSLKSQSGAWWKPLVVGVVCVCAYIGIGYNISTAPMSVQLPSGNMRELSREDRKHQRETERIMVEAERAVKAKDWDKAYEICENYAKQGERNHLMSYFRSMALYHQGKLLTNLLDYPQTFGVNSLFFSWKADRNRAEFGGYVYEQLGAVNAANHWAFEALVGWGETATHLTNLARYSVANGKMAQARKFIAPLKHTLFYRGRARELEKMVETGVVPDLKNSLADTPQIPARWDNVINLGADLRYILLSDPDNEMAREYIVAHFLLANSLGVFYSNLKDFWPMPEEGYLPPMVEQGLALVRLQIGEAQFAADGYRISPKTEEMFRSFMTELRKGDQAHYSPELRRTYWYYVQKVSPYGKELIY